LGIEAYFQQLREVIDTSPVVSAFNVTYDKRASHEGFIRGEIYFIDGSILHHIMSISKVMLSLVPDDLQKRFMEQEKKLREFWEKKFKPQKMQTYYASELPFHALKCRFKAKITLLF
jgi:hypothetical protein